MIRRIAFCAIVLVASLSGGGPARAATGAPPDLSGEWRLDPKQSDTPQRSGSGDHTRHGGGRGSWGGGGGGFGGGMGGSGWGGRGGRRGGGGGWGGGGARDGGSTGGPDGAAGARPMRLPDLIRVTQTATVVSFADSTGAVLREVATAPAEADSSAQTPVVDHVAGQWKGDKLIVQRSGPRDSKITETISLKDKGKSLLIDTKLESSGDMPSREFKRVYDRVTPT